MRPLGEPALLLQLASAAVIEAALIFAGARSSFDVHWVSSFLTSLTVAAALAATWLAVMSSPAPGQLLWLPGLHLFAVFPDLVGRASSAHAGWANAFLAHDFATRIVGGNRTLLVLATLVTGTYAALLWAWMSARRAETALGLAPGVGIGGVGLVRPQLAAATTPLAGHRFGPPGPPRVVLLHGLAASRAIWHDVIAELESREIAGVAPDLLGFGASRRIGTQFMLADHVAALRVALGDHDRRAPVVLVGHSFGCAVAAAFAAEHPELVGHLILVSPPVFRDAASARERLGHRNWLARQIVAGTPAASVTCGLMCLGRPLAAAAATHLARDIPGQVARDSVEHSWPSYRDAVLSLLEANPLPDAIEHPVRPTSIIVSSADTEAPAEDVTGHPHDAVEVIELSGDHLAPLHHARTIAALTAEHVGRSRG